MFDIFLGACYFLGMARKKKDQPTGRMLNIRVTQEQYDAIRRAADSQPPTARRGPKGRIGDWCRATLLDAATRGSSVASHPVPTDQGQ